RYLPPINQQGTDVIRTINMNAPVAFVLLLAQLDVSRKKGWIIAGLGILCANLIWSFTRGLWLATAASVILLLIIQPAQFRKTVLKFAFFSFLVAVPLAYLSGFATVIEDRIVYTATQFGGASTEEQTLSSRRLLEYLLILPQVGEHPFVGKGLGATY